MGSSAAGMVLTSASQVQDAGQLDPGGGHVNPGAWVIRHQRRRPAGGVSDPGQRSGCVLCAGLPRHVRTPAVWTSQNRTETTLVAARYDGFRVPGDAPVLRDVAVPDH